MSGCFASFFHHKHRLRALSIDGQAWFVVRDLGKLLNAWLGKRAVRDLDDVGAPALHLVTLANAGAQKHGRTTRRGMRRLAAALGHPDAFSLREAARRECSG